jgi:hypothetical protein
MNIELATFAKDIKASDQDNVAKLFAVRTVWRNLRPRLATNQENRENILRLLLLASGLQQFVDVGAVEGMLALEDE